jgi:hypothetical protein
VQGPRGHPGAWWLPGPVLLLQQMCTDRAGGGREGLGHACDPTPWQHPLRAASSQHNHRNTQHRISAE